MISVRDLTVSYGALPALQELSFDVPAGQFLLLTGPSGCGKSTVARALAGLIPQAIPATMSGTVSVGGLDSRSTPVAELAQVVGSVFQNPASQLFHLRVEDEVAFGPRNLGLDEDEVAERVAWALAATGLRDLREERPAELSGGQQQRVAIAAALAMRPQILVLDEPTASLDVAGTRLVMETLDSLRREHGVTIVLVEHRLAAAVRLADRVLLLDQGRLLRDGAPEQLLADRHLRDELGLRRPVEEPLAPWRTLLHPNGHRTGPHPPLLELDNVTAGYGRHPVLHDLSLTLDEGEFVALVGANGAGKSTLALTMAGLIKPREGKLTFDGGRHPRPGRDVALLFQNPGDQLFTASVGEEVAFGPRNYGVFDADFHEQTLRQADLVELSGRRPTWLSVGQQQRTALAAAVAMRPRLLILDEPTMGQDWGHLQRLMDFVTTLHEQGTTIVLISHDYKLIYRYAQRVLLMEEGRVVLDGQLEDQGERLLA